MGKIALEISIWEAHRKTTHEGNQIGEDQGKKDRTGEVIMGICSRKIVRRKESRIEGGGLAIRKKNMQRKGNIGCYQQWWNIIYGKSQRNY